jgi:hypothetical protein
VWGGIAVSLVMLFERQRMLLTLLDAVGEPVGDTDSQMLLFLYTQECEATPSYDFVPDKFGALSFTSCADKRKLFKAGLLAEDDQNWKFTKAGRAAARRQAVEPSRLAEFCRKYGFPKGTLGKACEEVGIRYEYLPALGIASEKRRELQSQADDEALFAEHERESLPQQGAALETIRGWVAAGERVALTCFERLPQ